MKRLSQAIADGEGITILVEVDSAHSAQAAERQGADGLVAGAAASEVRRSSQLPLLHRGGTAAASDVGADAVVVAPEPAPWAEAHALGLEGVVRVESSAELARALEELDPEVFLLAAEPGSDDDPLETLLALLHDVPAGKLAIADLRDATADDVAELERAGIDAVVVATADVAAFVPDEPPAIY